MRKIVSEYNVYSFDELSDSAKQNARDWFISIIESFDYADFTINSFKEIANMLGFTISNTYFSGFWSQGDGACFEGSYYYAKHSVKSIKMYAPNDATLNDIAERLAAMQKRCFYNVSAKIRHSGFYYHERSMSFDVEDEGYAGKAFAEMEDEFKEICADLARWLYKSLEAEYEYVTSDEYIEESILANGYEFYENGKIA